MNEMEKVFYQLSKVLEVSNSTDVDETIGEWLERGYKSLLTWYIASWLCLQLSATLLFQFPALFSQMQSTQKSSIVLQPVFSPHVVNIVPFVPTAFAQIT